MTSAATLAAIAPASKPYIPQLMLQMKRAQITDNPKRAAMFCAQVHVESGGFRHVVENLNYSYDALRAMFSSRRISGGDARRYGRTDDHPADQEALANILYGGEFGRKQLGNTEVGDGWKFRGRGLKQLTGRANYRAFSLAWLGNEVLLSQPELVELPNGAVASAVWFWTNRRLNVVADTGDVVAVTKVVNGGLNGLADRQRWYDKYLAAFRS